MNQGATEAYSSPDPGANLIRCRQQYRKSFNYVTEPAQNAGLPGAVQYISHLAGVNKNGVYVDLGGMIKGINTPDTQTLFSPSSASANWFNTRSGADSGLAVVRNNGDMGMFIENPQAAGDAAGDLMAVHYVVDRRVNG